MEKLIHRLQGDFPAYTFNAGPVAHWSPQTQEVFYGAQEERLTAPWSILHELGHALLGHNTYQNDVSLLLKESDAWSKACALATRYGIHIDADHIQKCLDTYRDWLHKRSTCPTCHGHGVQQASTYTCLNCRAQWHVGAARFCRTYRRSAN
jgi:hypothetical protein